MAIMDSGLVERARMGEAAALDQLLAACRPDLSRYAKRHCQSDDIEEAVQDALWIVYRKIGALRTVAAFTGWMFQVVKRACLAYARRRLRFLPLEDIAERQDETVSDPDLRLALVQALERMDCDYRAILLLRDVEGCSSEEAAAALGISVMAAKSRLHRARALVRAELSEFKT